MEGMIQTVFWKSKFKKKKKKNCQNFPWVGASVLISNGVPQRVNAALLLPSSRERSTTEC